ncbi:MAG: thioredoxin domain-containing protein [Methanomicrobiales archaeon]|nr:thioredoxin domain-containing protein [Methanomicrobiales archaeon]
MTEDTCKDPKPNRLIAESSPYLLQHACNPVHWFPWGEEAFHRAQEENKPIFLSIGYATCHWCHVMEQESFENQEIADLLNRSFISIKVDREERPDIDQVYMGVSQMMTGRGGWPLTIVMTPDKKPFFAGTYIPPETGRGMTGLRDILLQLDELWKSRKEDIEAFVAKVTDALKEEEQGPSGNDPSSAILEKAYRSLEQAFDHENGGFGDPPRFPSPSHLLLLLRIWYRGNTPFALTMVERTLLAMRNGGIFDQAGFGFHRYAVDRRWIVPHFEKMLYDQGLLAIAYLEAYQVSKRPEFAETAREIFTYVLRDLTSPEGGFYAGEDADSEGVEGKFYLWTWDELTRALSPDDFSFLSQVFVIDRAGNLPIPVPNAPPGANILYRGQTEEKVAEKQGIPVDRVRDEIVRILATLRELREARIQPARDTQILADWNGLMIAALAIGGRVLGEETYTEAAVRAADFIFTRLRDPEGHLAHVLTGEKIHPEVFSDDYAAMAWGEIELYETTFDPIHLKRAMSLMEHLTTRFWDREHGGYYFAPNEAEPLLTRSKETFDGAIPSGNSLALHNLLRLASLTGNTAIGNQALSLWRTFSASVESVPTAFTFLLIGLDLALGPTSEVIVTGQMSDAREMVHALQRNFLPRTSVVLVTPETSSALSDLISGSASYHVSLENATAYVCSGRQCCPPTGEVEKMLQYLSISK